MNKCIFDRSRNYCRCLTEKNCAGCKFYADSNKFYIDKKTRYVGRKSNGVELPLDVTIRC